MAILNIPRLPSPYLTCDEFLALAEIKPYLEYDNGVVSQKCAADLNHSALQGEISSRLNRIGRDRRLGIAFIELRFVTPTWVPTLDASYYSKERIRPVLRVKNGELYVPPDVAVEIASPGESREHLIQKCVRYVALGTSVGLVVDPDDETVYDVRPGEPQRVLRGDDQIDLEPVLPGFDLTAQALFDSIVNSWLVEEAPDEQQPAAE